MSISKKTREKVRSRANFSCEYCGVAETDSGSELTIDHFHPPGKGGDDDLDNLIYCCPRCNLYKSDYFPENPKDERLWNPRKENKSDHFILLDDGLLKGITPKGEFSIRLLRLNRPQLISLRIQRKKLEDDRELMEQLLEISKLLRQTNDQVNSLSFQQQRLLEEQQFLLSLLTKKDI